MVLYCLDVILSPPAICKSKMLDYLKQMTHLATQTQNVSRMATVAPSNRRPKWQRKKGGEERGDATMHTHPT
jgi:hypothetical protein